MGGTAVYTHIDDDHLAYGTHIGPLEFHYKFNETSGVVVADAVYNHASTITGTTTWATGQLDNCISSAAGTGYVPVPATSLSLFNSGFSIGCWVKPDDGQPTTAQYFFGVFTTSGDAFYFGVGPTGIIRAVYYIGGVSHMAYTTAAVFANGAAATFTHVGVTVSDNRGITVYIDGAAVATTDTRNSGLNMSAWTETAYPYVLGLNYNGALGFAFYGDLDDLRFYKRPLSAQAMEDMYSGNATLTDTGSLFKTLGVITGVYCENVTTSTGGAITAVTDDTIVATGVTWSPGDTYKTYKTATKSSVISTMATDRSRGWKSDPEELVNGWIAEDVDLDDHGTKKVFGPGQPS